MLAGWFLGFTIAIIFLFVCDDQALKGWLVILLIYYAIGIIYRLHKLEHRKFPGSDEIKKHIDKIANEHRATELELRAQLLKQATFITDVNKLVGQLLKENQQLKHGVAQLTDILIEASQPKQQNIEEDTPEKVQLNNTENTEKGETN